MNINATTSTPHFNGLWKTEAGYENMNADDDFPVNNVRRIYYPFLDETATGNYNGCDMGRDDFFPKSFEADCHRNVSFEYGETLPFTTQDWLNYRKYKPYPELKEYINDQLRAHDLDEHIVHQDM